MQLQPDIAQDDLSRDAITGGILCGLCVLLLLPGVLGLWLLKLLRRVKLRPGGACKSQK